jgi:glutaredoxin
MKTTTKIVILIAAVALVALISYFLFVSITGKVTEVGIYDDFAHCLTEKGVVMYGAYWCPHCARQKELFGSSWKYVSYVECDPRGNNAQPELCRQQGVTAYPTWIFNGEKRTGVQSLLSLSSWSGCQLP